MTGRSPGPAPDPRFTPDDVRLGYVNGVFGLRGEVKLFLYNPASDLVDEANQVVLVSPSGDRRTVSMVIRAGAGRRILGEIDGVESPEAAASLKDFEVVLPRKALPAPDHGEWYHRDLIGTAVRTQLGEDLGKLAEIVSGPGVDTWVIRGKGGEVWVHAMLDDLLSVEPTVEIVVKDAAVLRL